MKILWLVNIIIPRVAQKIQKKIEHFGGGWLSGISDQLLLSGEYKLSICSPDVNATHIQYFEVEEGLTACFFPIKNMKKYDSGLKHTFIDILDRQKPDIVHIFGTEYPQTLSMIEATDRYIPVVISITGMVYYCSKVYFGSVPENMRRPGLRYIIAKLLGHQLTLYQGYQDMRHRAQYEIRAIQQAKNVIGRTDWDNACTSIINPNIQYFFCNETLRKEFYECTWEESRCERHSILVPNIGYPIKGFEQFLEGFALLRRRYPDAKVYIPGASSSFREKSIKKKIVRWLSDYNHYLSVKMKTLELEESIVFYGSQSAEQMRNLMLKCNAFVLPSIIENSPNTLGEAMLLGMPVVSSCVGGVQSILKDKVEGYIYPYNEPYMIAYYVSKIFEGENLSQMTSNAQKHARMLYSQEKNSEELINIYQNIAALRMDQTNEIGAT